MISQVPIEHSQIYCAKHCIRSTFVHCLSLSSFLSALQPNCSTFAHFQIPSVPSECFSRSPLTHFLHFQPLSDALHSYPADFISSSFPLCSLKTPLLFSLYKQIITIFPLVHSCALHFLLCTLRSHQFPYLGTQIFFGPFSISLVLTFLPWASLHPHRCPQIPSADLHGCSDPTVPSVGAQFLWVPP